MSPTGIRWLPRVAAALFTLFIGLFSFDSGSDGEGAGMLDVLMHLMPMLFCGLIILLAWQREWIGALVFLALALFYGWWARDHVQWILVIGGPLLLIAGLYGWAWVARKRTPTA